MRPQFLRDAMPDGMIYYVANVNRAGQYASYSLCLVRRNIAGALLELDSHMLGVRNKHVQGINEKYRQALDGGRSFFIKYDEASQKPINKKSKASVQERINQIRENHERIKFKQLIFANDKNKLLDGAPSENCTGLAGVLRIHQLVSPEELRALLGKKVEDGGLQNKSIIRLTR